MSHLHPMYDTTWIWYWQLQAHMLATLALSAHFSRIVAKIKAFDHEHVDTNGANRRDVGQAGIEATSQHAGCSIDRDHHRHSLSFKSLSGRSRRRTLTEDAVQMHLAKVRILARQLTVALTVRAPLWPF